MSWCTTAMLVWQLIIIAVAIPILVIAGREIYRWHREGKGGRDVTDHSL